MQIPQTTLSDNEYDELYLALEHRRSKLVERKINLEILEQTRYVAGALQCTLENIAAIDSLITKLL